MATRLSGTFLQRMLDDYGDQAPRLERPMFVSLHTSTASEMQANAQRALDQVTDPRYWLGGTLADTTITWDGLEGEGFTEGELDEEPYPCQLCWAAARWPWEPLRACPSFVDVELTYCTRHCST